MNTLPYSTTMKGSLTDLNAFARVDRDDVLADQADLTVVILFGALGLLLTATFFILGFGTEIAGILAASG